MRTVSNYNYLSETYAQNNLQNVHSEGSIKFMDRKMKNREKGNNKILLPNAVLQKYELQFNRLTCLEKPIQNNVLRSIGSSI